MGQNTINSKNIFEGIMKSYRMKRPKKGGAKEGAYFDFKVVIENFQDESFYTYIPMSKNDFDEKKPLIYSLTP